MARRAHVPLLLTLTVLGGPALAAKDEVHLFASEQEAEQHCPSDIVVWVDTAMRIYHYRGQDHYGSTKSGGYACRKELAGSPYRPNRTGK